MAKELQVAYVTGRTVYFQLFDAVGRVRDVVTPEWETYATAQIGDYDVAATEQGTASGVYMADFPSSISAGVYQVLARDRAGGSPAEADILVGQGLVQWDGSVLVPLSSRLATTAYTAPLDAAGVRSAVGLASANLDTQLSTIDGVVDAILDDTGTTGVVVASGSKTGFSLSSSGLDLITYDGKTLPQLVLYTAAAAAGKVSGAGTGTEVFKGLDGSTTRLTATVDSSGNRTAITYG